MAEVTGPAEAGQQTRGAGLVDILLGLGLGHRLAALVLLIVAAPVLVVLVLALVVSRRPVLDRRARVGQFGRRFDLYGFGSGPLRRLLELVNVLRGDLRLVGPHPHSPAEVAAYDDRTWRRLLVKPGLTGSWLVDRRPDLTDEERSELDLDYVRDWSPRLDLALLARTPRAVLARHRSA